MSNVISLYFPCCSVGSVCLVCLTVFVKCLVKQLAIFWDVVVNVLLNVIEVLLKSLCWIDRVCSSKECACDVSVHLDVSFIGFVYVCVC